MGGDNSGMGDSHAASARKLYCADHCVSRTVRLQRSRSRTRFLHAERGRCCPLTADYADEKRIWSVVRRLRRFTQIFLPASFLKSADSCFCFLRSTLTLRL